MTLNTSAKTESGAAERVLLPNSWFSTGSGTLLAIGGLALDDLLGPPGWLIALVGAGVIAFGLATRIGARANPMKTLHAVFAADVAWIIGVAILLVVAGGSFTAVGIVLTVAVTGGVVWFAWREWRVLAG